MPSTSAKKVEAQVRIEKKQFTSEDGTSLEVGFYFPLNSPRALYFAPPLPGGSSSLQYRYMQGLVDAGNLLVSFNYRGHKGSGGKFTVRDSLKDSLSILRWLKSNFNLPAYGVGTCYGAMPLFSILSVAPELLEKVVFVNAITSLHHVATPAEVMGFYYADNFFKNPFDLYGIGHAFAKAVLPEIDSSRQHFGVLQLDRVNIFSFLREFLFLNPRKTLGKISTPALCCYGLQDKLLKLHLEDQRNTYDNTFHSHFSNMQFFRHPADHFFDNQLSVIHKTILDFCQPAESDTAFGGWGQT